MKIKLITSILLMLHCICSNALSLSVNKSIVTHDQTWTLLTIESTSTRTICHWKVTSKNHPTTAWMTDGVYIEGNDGRKYNAISSTLPNQDSPQIIDANKSFLFDVVFPAIPQMPKYLKYYSADSFYIADIQTNGDQSKAYTSSDVILYELREKANNGDAAAQFEMAHCYATGFGGLDESPMDMLYWTKEAAKNGDPDAQNFLAKLQAQAGNSQEAFELWQKSAQQGNVSSMYSLAVCYESGDGVTQNYSKAIEWYKKAMQNNHPWAFNNMAYLYFDGNGVPQDRNKAIELVNTAIKLDPEEPNFLDTKGELYIKLGEIQKASEVWEQLKFLDANYASNDNSVFTQYMRENYNSQKSFASNNSNNTFVVIVSNENYKYESKVPFAINDGESLSLFFQNTLKIPSNNIMFVKNGTYNDMKYSINWLKQIISAYNGDAKVIFYYAGHGIPDESSKSALLLPVDGNGNDPTTGYSLSSLYKSLGAMPTKSVLVLLDACFSGTQRDGSMMKAARGIAIKTKATSPSHNMVVLSASQGDETAGAYNEKQHGLFTFYLLQKLKETSGNVSLGDLYTFLETEVKRQSVVINKKQQTPSIIPSSEMTDKWKIQSFR